MTIVLFVMIQNYIFKTIVPFCDDTTFHIEDDGPFCDDTTLHIEDDGPFCDDTIIHIEFVPSQKG
jgi:hypothetical protein